MNIVALCANGHLHRWPEGEGETEWCQVCEEGIVWKIEVNEDQPIELLEVQPARGAVCPVCGVHKYIEPPRYEIPNIFNATDVDDIDDDGDDDE